MNALPKWVWDLVADLEDEEDLHPKLFADTANGYVRYDWCPAKALKRVPDDIRSAARVIAAYRQVIAEPNACTCPDLDASTPTDPRATVKGLDRDCPQHGGGS